MFPFSIILWRIAFSEKDNSISVPPCSSRTLLLLPHEEVKATFLPLEIGRALATCCDKEGVSGVMPCDFWVWVLEAKRLFPGCLSLSLSLSVTCPGNPAPMFTGWSGHMDKPQAGAPAKVSAKSQSAARCGKRAVRWLQPPGFRSSGWGPRHCGAETSHLSGSLSRFLIYKVLEHNVFCCEVSVARYRAIGNQDVRARSVKHVREGYPALNVGHPPTPVMSMFLGFSCF